MIPSTAVLVEEDATILLTRALLGKSICAFGEDGLGQHGRQSQAMWFRISGLTVDIHGDDDDPMLMKGFAMIFLDGYDASITGHIATDRNFDICLQAFLKNVGVDPTCFSWPNDINRQGGHSVVIALNVPLLIGFI